MCVLWLTCVDIAPTAKANLAASQELPFAELSYSYKAVRRLWDNVRLLALISL
jgi:hypothetical protein